MHADLDLHVYRNAELLARGAADAVATELGWAIQRRGVATFAISGGRTPWRMLAALTRHPVQWSSVEIFQVDERAVPDDDPDRNLTGLRRALLDVVGVAPERVHTIPIGADLDACAEQYESELRAVCDGTLDVVHLGLGPDGHTASLVPGDPVCTLDDRFVATTGEYQGHRRITLTFPALAAARSLIWLVDGVEKAPALHRLLEADPSIPAGLVPHDHAHFFCDLAAMGERPGEG